MSVQVSTPPKMAVGDTQSAVRDFAQRVRDGDLGVLPVVFGLLLIGGFFAFKSDAFLTSRNLTNLILQMAGIATISFGSVIVLLLAEVDLSAGPLSAFAAAVMGVLSTNQGWPAIPAILAAFAVGCGCGLVTGALITRLGVPSFVVTLSVSSGTKFIVIGTILVISVSIDAITRNRRRAAGRL
jgi:D-xylose transport system permease protein